MTQSVIYKTLNAVFRNVLILPGMKTFFIASDDSLTLEIPQRIYKQGIQTTYVNKNYIDEVSYKRRSAQLLSTINTNVSINKDFEPIAYHNQLRYWLSYFEIDFWLIGIIIILLIIIFLARLSAVSFVMFTGGFIASSVEIIILIGFQILCGYLYLMLGMVITAFMAGLAGGSFWIRKKKLKYNRRTFFLIQCILALYCFLLPIILGLLQHFTVGDLVVQSVFVIITLLIGALIGALFATCTFILQGTTTSITARLYSADLVGSALGALVAGTILIPLMGINYSAMILTVLILISFFVSFFYRKRIGV